MIVYGNSAKTHNLRRDPRCTVMAVDNDWRSYAVVEGQAQLLDYRNTPSRIFGYCCGVSTGLAATKTIPTGKSMTKRWCGRTRSWYL